MRKLRCREISTIGQKSHSAGPGSRSQVSMILELTGYKVSHISRIGYWINWETVDS